jgi:Uma2 family endonuclease
MVRLSFLAVDQVSDHVKIPLSVIDLASFRRWMDSDDFPELGRIEYIKGEVWIDMSKEQVFTHVLVKTRITAVLSELVEANEGGLFLGDGVLLSNVDADIAVKPDALFASTDTLADRVRILEGQKEGHVELEGSPDMVLEVVSDSSVRKDTQQLRRDYWEAGIREYWLVDARQDPLVFDILRYMSKGYRTTPKKEGWVNSTVFGKAFRLTHRVDALGRPKYRLEMR